ncbi:MAG: universal stress protein [Janthinobacterium lividum]
MYQHILVAIDGSETSACALTEALKMAREQGAELTPLYVIDVTPLMYAGPAYDPSIARNAFIQEGTRVIADATEQMKREDVKGSPIMREVDPAGDDIPNQVMRAAEEFNADLIVMGTHGRRGWRRLVLGSVAEQVLRISSRPVLLVPLGAATQKAPPAVIAPAVVGTA